MGFSLSGLASAVTNEGGINLPSFLKESKDTKRPYCIALALVNAKKGRMHNGFAFAGENAYRTEKIVTVKELINTLIEEYDLAATD